MSRYIFSRGKVTVEEGVFTPFKQLDKQSLRGVLLFAQDILKTGEQQKSTDKEKVHVHE
jgi:hypothetical protein